MPKKKSVEDTLHKYAKDVISVLVNQVGTGMGTSLEKLSHIFSLRRKLRHYAVAIILMISGLILSLYGLGTFIETLLPSLPKGTAFFILGLIVMAIAYFYKKAI